MGYGVTLWMVGHGAFAYLTGHRVLGNFFSSYPYRPFIEVLGLAFAFCIYIPFIPFV
jgi:hypothetical protein